MGVNPKINNMQPGYSAAKYGLVLVSDSGVRMREDTLTDMVEHMTARVGLVHQMPFAHDRGGGVPAVLEKVRLALKIRVFLLKCVLGKGLLLAYNFESLPFCFCGI